MDEQAMLAAADAAGRGPRSAGFPALSLPEATTIITTAAGHGRQHNLVALAAYAGHATSNSGPFRQKLAALKDWGFVTVAGETAAITDRGMGIALPASPVSELDLLRQAFQGCGIFWDVYCDTAKGVPIQPETIGNNAVTMHGINAKNRGKFVKSFVDSAIAVGMAERLSTGEVRLLGNNGEIVPSARPPITLDAGTHQPLPEIVPETPAAAIPQALSETALRPAISQVWKNGDTEIIFEVRSSGPLPSVAFMEIGTAVTSIEVLWEALQGGQ